MVLSPQNLGRPHRSNVCRDRIERHCPTPDVGRHVPWNGMVLERGKEAAIYHNRKARSLPFATTSPDRPPRHPRSTQLGFPLLHTQRIESQSGCVCSPCVPCVCSGQSGSSGRDPPIPGNVFVCTIRLRAVSDTHTQGTCRPADERFPHNPGSPTILSSIRRPRESLTIAQHELPLSDRRHY